MTIEVNIWVLVLFGIAFLLMLIHLIIGDILGKALYHHLKNKEKGDEDVSK